VDEVCDRWWSHLQQVKPADFPEFYMAGGPRLWPHLSLKLERNVIYCRTLENWLLNRPDGTVRRYDPKDGTWTVYPEGTPPVEVAKPVRLASPDDSPCLAVTSVVVSPDVRVGAAVRIREAGSGSVSNAAGGWRRV
jgi:hypothetical protein